MKKDKLIQEFESLKIDNASSIVGGCNWHRTEFVRYEKTNGPTGNTNDFHMDEIVDYMNDTDEGDTIVSMQQLFPRPILN